MGNRFNAIIESPTWELLSEACGDNGELNLLMAEFNRSPCTANAIRLANEINRDVNRYLDAASVQDEEGLEPHDDMERILDNRERAIDINDSTRAA